MNAYEMPPRSVNYRRLGTNTMEVSMQVNSTHEQRFWSKVDKSAGAGECWPWTGWRDRYGYGMYRLDGGGVRHANRLALEYALGRELLKAEWSCHRCDNPSCCNPDHLFVGNARSNGLDMMGKGRGGGVALNALKTHCNRGHELTPENIRPRKDGRRDCIACGNARARARRAFTSEEGAGR